MGLRGSIRRFVARFMTTAALDDLAAWQRATSTLVRGLHAPRDWAEAAITDLLDQAKANIDPDSLIRRLDQLTHTRPERQPPSPAETALYNRFFERLASIDQQIFCHYKQGRTYIEIAQLMGMDAEVVRSSLVRSFAALGEWMRMSPRPDGGGQHRTAVEDLDERKKVAG